MIPRFREVGDSSDNTGTGYHSDGFQNEDDYQGYDGNQGDRYQNQYGDHLDGYSDDCYQGDDPQRSGYQGDSYHGDGYHGDASNYDHTQPAASNDDYYGCDGGGEGSEHDTESVASSASFHVEENRHVSPLNRRRSVRLAQKRGEAMEDEYSPPTALLTRLDTTKTKLCNILLLC